MKYKYDNIINVLIQELSWIKRVEGRNNNGVLYRRHKKTPATGEGSNFGGAKRDRTADLLHAMQALSQLSYSPTCDFTNRTLLGSEFGGAKRDRTADLLHAMQALSQLSYSPNA